MAEIDQKDFLIIEKDGRRTGPHSVSALRQMFIEGRIDGSCKVHVKKLLGWKTVSETFDLREWATPAPPKPVPEPARPEEKPRRQTVQEERRPVAEKRDVKTEEKPSPLSTGKGIGRTGYLVYVVCGLLLLFSFLEFLTDADSRLLKSTLIGLYVIPLIPLTAQRLVNIGESPSWSLSMFVPLLNVMTLGRCLSCQEAYSETRSLDRAGQMIFGIYVFMVIMFATGALLIALYPDAL